jgi:hypothetical protein
MKTTGTATFDMDFSTIAEEAWERAGREMRSGYDLRTARRSMNLLSVEWGNRGINMWTIDQGSLTLVPGTASYDLPLDTIDLIEHVLRTGAGSVSTQTDLPLNRISVATYSTIPNKLTTGRPLQVWIQRLSGQTDADNTVQYPKIHVWPVPDSSQTYTLVYWRLRRIQDAGAGIQSADAPFRFLNALVAGLAYYIALKVPELMPRVDMLKAVYEEQMQLAMGEDRDRASVRFVPRMSITR